MHTARERLLQLLRERSYQRGEVLLASGKKSDFFIDCKKTVLAPDGHLLAGEVLCRELEEAAETKDGLAALAAVPLGGCPLAGATALVAFQRGLPVNLLYVRQEKKDHGTGQRIEGSHGLPSGSKVVLVEDVVTTGGSSLRAVAGLREAGFEVVLLLALVDRLEGGRENIEAQGVTFRSVFTRRDFVQ